VIVIQPVRGGFRGGSVQLSARHTRAPGGVRAEVCGQSACTNRRANSSPKSVGEAVTAGYSVCIPALDAASYSRCADKCAVVGHIDRGAVRTEGKIRRAVGIRNRVSGSRSGLSQRTRSR